MTTVYQENWFATAVGRATDPDHVGGFQCVDTAKDYAERIWAATVWQNAWPGAGNAKDMISTASTAYWDIIINDPTAHDQIPQRGDVIVWGGTGDNGVNPYGHIAVVTGADINGVDVIQQDGFLQVPMFADRLGYWNPGTGTVIGWLRPKFDDYVSLPQGSTVTPITPETVAIVNGAINGIDISSHNAGIDIAATGAKWVAVKVSEGIGWEDTTAAGYNWRDRVREARAIGARVFFYHFARPGAQNDPAIEADWFIRCIQPIFQPGDGVVLDWESNAAGENLHNVAWAKVWLDAVCARLSIPARDAWFYTYTAILHNGADWGLINRTYPLWHAEYGANEEQNWGPAAGRTRTPIDWPAGVAGWQYTSKGLITGTRGYTDLNAIYFTTTASEEEIMATVHDIFVQPISDKNQKQFSQFLEDADARLQLLVDALTPGKEGVKFEGEVLKALNELKAAVTAQAQDPAAIAKLVIDGIGAQKAEDVLIELGKLINAAVTPPTA